VVAVTGDYVDVCQLRKFENPLERVREVLTITSGSVQRAFKKMDLNGNGLLSYTELKQGLEMFKVPWEHLTGCPMIRLFRLFDTSKCGNVNVNDMVGYTVTETIDWAHMTVDQQWDYYGKKVEELCETLKRIEGEPRRPRWESRNEELKLQRLIDNSKRTMETYSHRKWLKRMFEQVDLFGIVERYDL
jgi:Ca2+-binding EF-hand superfamily protein